ncbi:MAG TPA: single-stranded DNA-binding protein [Patescibacteria group bacterium]|nr:single-stranded DNA-binding protein [Patescibacteria group bacterium]
MDLNKVMIIGRLTRDPELRTTPSGASVCALGLATNFVYNNQQTGQKVEQVEYHNVVLWRKLGEIAAQYLKKGRRVYIEGRLQTRSWDGKDGQKRNRTEIVADNMIMLDGGTPGTGGSAFAGQESAGRTAAPAGQPAVASQPRPSETAAEELPTIQQDEDINVEDIPF